MPFAFTERSACSACGTSATVADWPHRGVHARTSRFDLYACGRRHDGVARSPALAQAPPDPSSRRADLLGDARESLTDRIRPAGALDDRAGAVLVRQPVRAGETVRRMEGIHLAGGDFPAGAGSKSASDSHVDRSCRYRPRAPESRRLTARAAYGTRGYSRLSGGVNRATSAERRSNRRVRPVLRVRAGRLLRARHRQQREDAPTTCSTSRKRRRRSVEPFKLTSAWPPATSLRGSDTDRTAGFLRPRTGSTGVDPGPWHTDRFLKAEPSGVRLARPAVAPPRRRPVRGQRCEFDDRDLG